MSSPSSSGSSGSSSSGSGSEEDDDHNNHSSGEDEEKQPTTGKKTKLPVKKIVSKSHRNDDDDDDDDEEEDDDDDEDDDEEDDDSEEEDNRRGKRSRGKKRKKSSFNPFEEIAEEGSGDEESSEGVERSGIDYAEDLAIKKRLEDRLRKEAEFRNKSAEELAKELEARHRYREAEEGDEVLVEAASRSYAPRDDDPNLYSVKCKPGEERAFVLRFMHMFVHKAEKPKCVSVVASGSKGFFYVEAYNESHVKDMLRGIQGVYASKMTLVPKMQMNRVLQINEKALDDVKIGSYVRIRLGPYKHDLGRVYDKDNANQYMVMLIPRVDYSFLQLSEEKRREKNKEDRANKRKRPIPAKKLFNKDEALSLGISVGRKAMGEEDYDEIEDMLFRKGFLYKTFNRRALETTKVNPTLTELQAFVGMKSRIEEEASKPEEADAEAIHMANSAFISSTAKQNLVRGDIVKVISGDLTNLQGEVLSVNNNTEMVTVQFNMAEKGIKLEPHQMPFSAVQKHFKDLDHVKVVGGRYSGETGYIVETLGGEIPLGEESTAPQRVFIVKTDTTAREIQVFVNDLRLSNEISSGKDSLGDCKLYDPVMLADNRTMGMIVNVGNSNLTILTDKGETRQVVPTEIRFKLNNQAKKVSALDKNNQTIVVNDVVKIVAGENQGKEASVKFMQRAILFLHSNKRPGNAGIFVERARNVILAGERIAAPVLARNHNPSRELSHLKHRSGGGAAGKKDEKGSLLMLQVRVKKGKFKGKIGLVTDILGDNVRIELEKGKYATVPKQEVLMLQESNSRLPDLPNPAILRQPYGNSALSGGMIPSTPLHMPSTPWENHEETDVHGGNSYAPSSSLSSNPLNYGQSSSSGSAFMPPAAPTGTKSNINDNTMPAPTFLPPSSSRPSGVVQTPGYFATPAYVATPAEDDGHVYPSTPGAALYHRQSSIPESHHHQQQQQQQQRFLKPETPYIPNTPAAVPQTPNMPQTPAAGLGQDDRTIREGDIVEVLEGPHKGRSAEVTSFGVDGRLVVAIASGEEIALNANQVSKLMD